MAAGYSDLPRKVEHVFVLSLAGDPGEGSVHYDDLCYGWAWEFWRRFGFHYG